MVNENKIKDITITIKIFKPPPPPPPRPSLTTTSTPPRLYSEAGNSPQLTFRGSICVHGDSWRDSLTPGCVLHPQRYHLSWSNANAIIPNFKHIYFQAGDRDTKARSYRGLKVTLQAGVKAQSKWKAGVVCMTKIAPPGCSTDPAAAWFLILLCSLVYVGVFMNSVFCLVACLCLCVWVKRQWLCIQQCKRLIAAPQIWCLVPYPAV